MSSKCGILYDDIRSSSLFSPFLAQSSGVNKMLWSWYQTPRVLRTVCSEGCSQISCVHLDRPAGACREGRCCYQRPRTLATCEWYWRGSLPLAPPSRKEVRALGGSKSFLRFLFSSRERKRELLGAQWRSCLIYRTWQESSENGDIGGFWRESQLW